MHEMHNAHPYDALVKMANEIASNIAPGQSQEQAAKVMVDHLVRFWAKSMKVQIIACLDMKNNRLLPTAEHAVTLLKEIQIQSDKKAKK